MWRRCRCGFRFRITHLRTHESIHNILGKLNRVQLHDIAVHQVANLHGKPDFHKSAAQKRRQFRAVRIICQIQQIGTWRTDVDHGSQHGRKRCSRRTHHLVHGLGYGAEMQFRNLSPIYIGAIAAHHQVSNDLHIPVFQHQDVGPIQSLRIFDLNEHTGSFVLVKHTLPSGQRYHGSGNIYFFIDQ